MYLFVLGDCDLISFQRICPLSILPLYDHTSDSQNSIHSSSSSSTSSTSLDEKFDSVQQQICQSKMILIVHSIVFSVHKTDLHSIWGKDRINELKAVLNDIDVVAAETQHFPSQ